MSIENFENRIIQGDTLEVLKQIPDECIDCVVTSPPYYGLRDYGEKGQIGLEQTFDCGKHGLMRLRSDLTEKQREEIVRRLVLAVTPGKRVRW